MTREIVLDTETTGFSPTQGHRLIEVGLYELVDRKPTGRTFHEYVDPCRDVPDQAVAIHGMNRDDLIQAGNGQKFKDIAENMLSFIGDSVLIIHNAKFDLRFLDFELEQCRLPPLSKSNPVFDTLVHANRIHPGQRNNLDALVRRYQIQTPDRSFHGALLDAEILASVYLAMTRQQNDLSLSEKIEAPSSSSREKLSIRRIDESISSRLTDVKVSRAELEDHLNYF